MKYASTNHVIKHTKIINNDAIWKAIIIFLIEYAIIIRVSIYAVTNPAIKYAMTNHVIKYAIPNDVIINIFL